MTVDILSDTIKNCVNDVIFTYNGKQSGITSTVSNYKPTYQAWHGSKTKEYSNLNDVLKDKFYSGSSLIELVDNTEFTIL